MAHEELPPINITPGAIRFNTDSMKLEYFRIGMEGGSTSSYAGIGTLAAGEWVQLTTDSPDIQTGGTRGVIAGGNYPGASVNDIEYINVDTTGNALDFGNLIGTTHGAGSCASSTRGLIGGGSPLNADIDFVTMASTGDAADFGNLNQTRDFLSALSSSTRGVFCSGRSATPATATNTIDFVTIASLASNQDFGDLSGGAVLYYPMTCASSTRGIITGGSPAFRDEIEFITISTTGNSADFGETSNNHAGGQGCSNSVRGVFGGGYTPGSTIVNIIDYITIASLGNASDFGDLTGVRRGLSACSSKTRGVWAGGCNPADVNTIDYIQIMTTGNAIDFGDLSGGNSGKKRNVCSASNGHGGLG